MPLPPPTVAQPEPELVLAEWPWANARGVLAHKLEIAQPTPSNNDIRGLHYFRYRKLRQWWAEQVFAAAGGRLPRSPIKCAFLSLERHCGEGGLDWDNAYGGLKPLLDCLSMPHPERNPSGLGFIQDDSPRCMPIPPFVMQLPAPRGQGKTVLRIFALA